MKANQLEIALFRSYWDDGLLDLLCGFGLLLIGLGWALDQVALAAALPALLVPLWGPLRRSLVEPRAGFVEFSQRVLEGSYLLMETGQCVLSKKVKGIAIYSASYDLQASLQCLQGDFRLPPHNENMGFVETTLCQRAPPSDVRKLPSRQV